MKGAKKKEFDWFDRPGVRRGLWVALWAACILTVVAEPVARKLQPEGHWEQPFSFFYASLGFVSCAAMILLAKLLGIWLKVPTDYYERKGESSADE